MMLHAVMPGIIDIMNTISATAQGTQHWSTIRLATCNKTKGSLKYDVMDTLNNKT